MRAFQHLPISIDEEGIKIFDTHIEHVEAQSHNRTQQKAEARTQDHLVHTTI